MREARAGRLDERLALDGRTLDRDEFGDLAAAALVYISPLFGVAVNTTNSR